MTFVGPQSWSNVESTCGSGANQSPISLEQSTSVINRFPALVFSNYDTVPRSMTLENNGVITQLQIGKIK